MRKKLPKPFALMLATLLPLCLAGCPYAEFENPVFEIGVGPESVPALEAPDARLEGVWLWANAEGFPEEVEGVRLPEFPPMVRAREDSFAAVLNALAAANNLPEEPLDGFGSQRVLALEAPLGLDELGGIVWGPAAVGIGSTIEGRLYLNVIFMGERHSGWFNTTRGLALTVARCEFPVPSEANVLLPSAMAAIQASESGLLPPDSAREGVLSLSTAELRAFLGAHPDALFPREAPYLLEMRKLSPEDAAAELKRLTEEFSTERPFEP